MLTPLSMLPKSFPLAFCGYLLDTPILCVVPHVGNGSVAQAQGMLFLFRNASSATLGLLTSGAQGMLTYPLGDSHHYCSLVSIQSVQLGTSLFVLCTTLTTTPSLLQGRFFPQ